MTLSFATINAQNIEVIKIHQLEDLLIEENQQLRIINFWATFCAPCIKEMPQFEEAKDSYSTKGVDIYLVSLDFVEDIEKVKKFISNKDLKNKILLLDEIDYNSWIDKVDKRWSGAIPTTLFIKNNEQKIVQRELRDGELKEIIETYMNI